MEDQPDNTQQAPEADQVEKQTAPLEVVQPNKPKVTGFKKFVPLVALAVIVIAGGAAAYRAISQKSPQELFQSALTNTVTTAEEFLSKERAESQGFQLTGSAVLTSPFPVSAQIIGSSYNNSAKFDSTISVAGLVIENETIAVTENDQQRFYTKLLGLEEAASLLGILSAENGGLASIAAGLDNQWIQIDESTVTDAIGADSEELEAQMLSEEQLSELRNRLVELSRDTLFATDENAVFTIVEESGEEDFEGTATYKMRVGINTENLKKYVNGLQDFLSQAEITELLMGILPEETLSQLQDTEGLMEMIDQLDLENAVADIWVEANGRYIRNIRIYSEKDITESYVDFSLPYEGGDVFPLVLRAVESTDNNPNQQVLLGIQVNRVTDDLKLWLDVSVNGDSPIQADGELTLTGNEEPVAIEVPTDALRAETLLETLSKELEGLLQGFPLQPTTTTPSESQLLDDVEIDFDAIQL